MVARIRQKQSENDSTLLSLRTTVEMQWWVLSKRAPKRYGDKADVTMNSIGLTTFTLGVGTA